MIVSSGALGCTNRKKKNSNILTLVTIIMLLQLYRGMFRSLAYLMPAVYSKPSQISDDEAY